MAENKFKKDTVVGIITCNREEMFQKCVASIDRNTVDKIIVVNGGKPYSSYPDDVVVIQQKRDGTVVGANKNSFWRRAKDLGYPFLFTMEDDIEITDNNVWQHYIETAADSGIWCGLSYGTHGDKTGGNVNADNEPLKRTTVQYTKHKVDLYPNSFAAFSLIHANVLKHVGYHDERYINAAEHLDWSYRSHLLGLNTPFFYFADAYDSFNYIKDQDKGHEKSIIRADKNFSKNFSYSWQLFKEKFGTFPTDIKDTNIEELQTLLDSIEQHYSQKQLLD